MTEIQMKMAKASKDDLERLNRFFQMLEEAIEYGTYATDGNAEPEQIEDEMLMELIRQHWGRFGPGVGASWRRVVFGCWVLIDNCCDPESDTLEWHPDICAWLEKEGV